MDISAISDAMADLGYSEKDTLALIKRLDEIKRERSRAANARRQSEWRSRNANNVGNAVTHVTRDTVTNNGITRDTVTDEASSCADIELHARADGNPNSLTTFGNYNTPSPTDSPPKSARSARCDSFEEFYRAYPKHVGRKAALAKFQAAVRSGVDPKKIISSAEQYAASVRSARLEDRFIPHPATWLGQGRYDDEHLPQQIARAGPRPNPNERGGFAMMYAEMLENDLEQRIEKTVTGEAVCGIPFRPNDEPDGGGGDDDGVSGKYFDFFR